MGRHGFAQGLHPGSARLTGEDLQMNDGGADDNAAAPVAALDAARVAALVILINERLLVTLLTAPNPMRASERTVHLKACWE